MVIKFLWLGFMDTSLNNLVLNNALKQQKPAAKSDITPAGKGPDARGAPPPSGTTQPPPLSIVQVLVPAALITNEPQVTETSQLKHSNKNYSTPETGHGYGDNGNIDGNAKRGTTAYQAAGAVSGAGQSDNSFDGNNAIIPPQNISPIDIEV